MFWFHTHHPDTGEPLEVEAAYSPARRGSRDRYGAPLEPDDAAELVIRHVWTRLGDPVDFEAFEDGLVVEGFRAVRASGAGWRATKPKV